MVYGLHLGGLRGRAQGLNVQVKVDKSRNAPYVIIGFVRLA